MYKLPLFPLNTVLFPGVPIVLHIFEQRYREMINECISKRKPFGVVLIEDGDEVGDGAEPREIGCSADIVNVERLEDGRMNIVAVGRDRFRILETDNERTFLQGTVEDFPLKSRVPREKLNDLSNELRGLLETYVEALQRLSNVQVAWEALPDDPTELGYLAAYVLQVVPEQKQEILQLSNAHSLLRRLITEFRTELSLIKHIVPTGTIFSLN